VADLLARLQSALGDAYSIERELGGGGMSRVFVAQDVELGRKVVVKALPPEMAAGVNADRFRREIQLAASLQHPHIVPVLHAGHAQDLVWYTMPLIEGESLRAMLARQDSLPIPDTVKILRDVVDALNYAHRHGVVHRDIKPDNVLLCDPHAVVTDFGVAKALGEATGESSITSIGVALGTPAYMAPEQAAADPHADHRCDVYAVGALAYEMLTGRPPFVRNSPQAVLAAQLSEAPVPVRMQRATVPPALAEAVMRCLEKRPADRWQSAEELLRLLEAMATPSEGTLPVAAARRTVSRSRPWLLAAGAAAAVVTMLVLVSRGRGGSGSTKVDPNVVAVLPFRVTGADPSLSYLRQGMIDLLAAELTGEGGPRAADPRTVLAAWRRVVPSSDADLPEGEAVRLAGRLGAGQLLLGGIVGTPTRVVLTASLITVPGSQMRAQGRAEGSPDSVPVLIGPLIGQLLARQAGEAERATSLASVPLPALRAYLDGEASYRRGLFQDAIRAFGQALDLDSSFALAGLGLGVAAASTSDFSQGDRGWAIAWAHRDRLSPRDLAELTAYVGPRYPAPSSELELLAARQRALDASPDRPEAWYEVGDELFHFGSLLGQESPHERARAYFRRALELDSTLVVAFIHLPELAAAAGDSAEARRLADLYLRRDSTGETADFVRWVALFAADDSTALRAQEARFGELATVDLTRIAQVTALNGRWLDQGDSATRVIGIRPATRQDRSANLDELVRYWLNRGRPTEALQAVDQLVAVNGPPHAGLWLRVLNALYGGGDTVAGREAAARLAPAAESGLEQVAATRATHLGDICVLEQWRMLHGDWKGVPNAITALRSAAPPRDDATTVEAAANCVVLLQALSAASARLPGAGRAVDRLDSLMQTGLPPELQAEYGNLVVGRLLEAAGNLPGALAASRRWVYRLGMPLFLSAQWREEGRLAALTGDRAGAIRAYQHYLALRSNPEPSVQPEVDDVRAQLARLIGEH